MSVARREEKGFDVNVAAHLLWDVLRGQPGQRPIQAAVIISNDSDIKLPIDHMDTLRRSSPVAVLCQRISLSPTDGPVFDRDVIHGEVGGVARCQVSLDAGGGG
ncbi:MAG: hypothetical protein ACLP4W_27120, partial [Mycobacterium sp.]